MTNIGLSSQGREKAQKFLFKVLSDVFLLTVKTRHYHWNVQGPHFQQYHKLFEEQYNDLIETQDILAERIRILDFMVPASMQNFLNISSLQEESDFPSASQMIKNLMMDHESLCHDMRDMIEELQETKDEGTIDLLIQRLQDHEKKAWILRSHLHA